MSDDERDLFEHTRLVYISDAAPGISRIRCGRGFRYRSPENLYITDPANISRIKSLAIPPAYQNVWISPLPEGHLQATGHDAVRRKQYRYHPEWRSFRDELKFERLYEFGLALPRLRRAIQREFRNGKEVRAVSKDLCCAAVVRLIDNAALRVGSDRSADAKGATTLTTKNIRLGGEVIRLDYTAKGGKRVRKQLSDKSLQQILQHIGDLKGKALFQFIGNDGEVHQLDSGDVNLWIKEHSGDDNASAKVFRTWHGTLAAYEAIKDAGKPTIKLACDAAANILQNTSAICRSSYVDPRILRLVTPGGRDEIEHAVEKSTDIRGLRIAERELLVLLKN